MEATAFGQFVSVLRAKMWLLRVSITFDVFAIVCLLRASQLGHSEQS